MTASVWLLLGLFGTLLQEPASDEAQALPANGEEGEEREMTLQELDAEFGKGNRYQDFDSSSDHLAANGIGGLIAGKLALKAGLFKGLIALLVAGKKVLIVALVGIAAFVRRLFGGKKAARATE